MQNYIVAVPEIDDSNLMDLDSEVESCDLTELDIDLLEKIYSLSQMRNTLNINVILKELGNLSSLIAPVEGATTSLLLSELTKTEANLLDMVTRPMHIMTLVICSGEEPQKVYQALYVLISIKLLRQVSEVEQIPSTKDLLQQITELEKPLANTISKLTKPNFDKRKLMLERKHDKNRGESQPVNLGFKRKNNVLLATLIVLATVIVAFWFIHHS